MKVIKKILTLFAVIGMLFTVCSTVAAENDGSITISNTTNGKTYSAYKVFDATYTTDNPQKVAYSYTKKSDTDAFLTALQSESSPFTVTEVGSTGVYTVVKKETATDSDIITFIKTNGPTYDDTSKTWSGGNYGGAAGTATGNGGSVTISGLAYGYYLITSTTGALVTIDSALKDVTVIDKNQTTTLDKQEKVANGSWVYEGPYNDSVTKPTANVGDTVQYKVTGTFTQYIGEDVVKSLIFTDTMSSGLTADKNVVVKINDKEKSINTDYTVTYELKDNGTTDDTSDDYWVTVITIPTATVSGDVVTFKYNPNNTYEITYSAKIDKDSIIDNIEDNVVDLDYTNKSDVRNDIGNDTTKVKNYNILLNKKDGKNTEVTTDDSALAGAKFKLYDKDGTTAKNVVLVSGTGTAVSTVDNVYRLAEADETSGVIQEMTVGTTGIIIIQGLANGQYEFEETEAPKGYNALNGRTEVAIINNANVSIDVVNNHGSKLPSTGGIGTTVFHVAGAALAIGAAVLLISKRRMNNN